MCGIFGYLDQRGNRMHDQQIVQMGESIKHRGPDGFGYYHDKNSAVALGNQRLAILDIEHGDQPFISEDGKIVVVQNGEIFNHVELARDLEKHGYHFNTTCDTEVILRLYQKDGIAGLSRLNGMFSIAIYDLNSKDLYLFRDRIGEKPFFYTVDNGRLVFASEIKAILEVLPGRKIDFAALNQFLTFNYVPPPLTIFAGIRHVMPGHYLRISEQHFEERCWWDLASVVCESRQESDWIDEYNEIIHDAVRIRLRADVPFGAFLSGGVDSSTVVGEMSKVLQQPVRTFSIGFDDPRYDESGFAQDAANRFSTAHTMKKVQANLMDLWPIATYHSDQPHGDVSFLPMYKVASLAAEQVKMVLTGDGADELFAGYDKYKEFFNEATDSLSIKAFQQQYLDNISLFTADQRRRLMHSQHSEVHQASQDFSYLHSLYEKCSEMDRINQALYLDMMLLLPGNNLVKTDRMSMAVSLENRSPFLDYRMMEYAFKMPGNLKLRDGETKYLFKKAVTPLIGENLAYRKKQMFTVPVGEWFKSELYPLCQELLFSHRAQSRGLFELEYVQQLFNRHCSGDENNTREIRALMAVETWFREFME